MLANELARIPSTFRMTWLRASASPSTPVPSDRRCATLVAASPNSAGDVTLACEAICAMADCLDLTVVAVRSARWTTSAAPQMSVTETATTTLRTFARSPDLTARTTHLMTSASVSSDR